MITIVQSPNEDCFAPTRNCGDTKVCVIDTDLIDIPATSAEIIVTFGLPAIGSTFTVLGETFSFVPFGQQSNANELSIQIFPSNVASSFALTLSGHPFFGDRFTYSVVGGTVIITAVETGELSNFINSSTVASVSIDSEINGTNEQGKSDYYFFIRAKNLETGKYLCAGATESIGVKATIIDTGTNKDASTCFDLQALFRDDNGLFVSPPDDSNPFISEDVNQFDRYTIEVYGSYLPSGQDCGKVKTTVVEVGVVCPIAGVVSFNEGEFCSMMTESLPTLPDDNFLTCLDSSEKVCIDSCIELRLATRGLSNLVAIVDHIYTDGTTSLYIDFLLTVEDKSVVRIYACADNMNADPSKTLASSRIRLFSSAPLGCVSERTIIWTNEKPCCDCKVEFSFLSSCGNNETIVGKCSEFTDVSLTYSTTCKTVECGSFDGGRVVFASKKEKVNKVLLKSKDAELLEEFLSSNRVYVREDREYKRIYGTDASYRINKKGKNSFVTFSYSYSVKR